MDLRMSLAPDPFASRQSLEKLAYRIPEAVAAIGISRTGIYELIKAGRLRVRKVGTRTLIERAELERMVRELPPGR
jgi:excisionase family DNA binding protein